MIKKQRIKKAFTLAELLIVIGVIGILAAITVPMLYNHANNKHLVSQTIKMANALTNGFKEADVIDGLSKKTKTSEFKSVLESHLKILSTCEEGYTCLADGGRIQYQDLSGNALDFGSGDVALPAVSDSPYAEGKATALKYSYVKILADVNGKKGPNEAGKDLYTFYVTKYGIFADGKSNECSGLDCGAYVIAHHKLWTGEVEEIANGGGAGEDPVSPGGGNSEEAAAYAYIGGSGPVLLSAEDCAADPNCSDALESEQVMPCYTVGTGYVCDTGEEYVVTASFSEYLASGRTDCNSKKCSFMDGSFNPTSRLYNGVYNSETAKTYSELAEECSSIGYSIPTSDDQIAPYVVSDGNLYVTSGGYACSEGEFVVKQYGHNNYSCKSTISSGTKAFCVAH